MGEWRVRAAAIHLRSPVSALERTTDSSQTSRQVRKPAHERKWRDLSHHVPSARHTRVSRTDVLYRRRSNTGGCELRLTRRIDPGTNQGWAGLLEDAPAVTKGGCYETNQLETGIFGRRRFYLRGFRFHRLVAKRRSLSIHDQRASPSRSPLDTCKRRRRCAPNDTSSGRRRSGSRRSHGRRSHGLSPRAGERGVCLPLIGRLQ